MILTCPVCSALMGGPEFPRDVQRWHDHIQRHVAELRSFYAAQHWRWPT